MAELWPRNKVVMGFKSCPRQPQLFFNFVMYMYKDTCIQPRFQVSNEENLRASPGTRLHLHVHVCIHMHELTLVVVASLLTCLD